MVTIVRFRLIVLGFRLWYRRFRALDGLNPGFGFQSPAVLGRFLASGIVDSSRVARLMSSPRSFGISWYQVISSCSGRLSRTSRSWVRSFSAFGARSSLIWSR